MAMYCFTVGGLLKILTIVLGGTSFGLGAYSYDETIVQEEFFLRTVQTTLILSVINLGISMALATKLKQSDLALAIDVAFHITAAVTLPIATGLIIYSTVDNERTYCQLIFTVYPHAFCQFYGFKMAAGIISMVNGTVYWITAATVFISGSPRRGQSDPMNKLGSTSSRNPIFSIQLDEKRRGAGAACAMPKRFYYGTTR